MSISDEQIEDLMEELEKIKLESDDMMPEFRRIIDRHNSNDYIMKAAILHTLSTLLVEYFLTNSDKSNMAAEEATSHWLSMVGNMVSAVDSHYKAKHN